MDEEGRNVKPISVAKDGVKPGLALVPIGTETHGGLEKSAC